MPLHKHLGPINVIGSIITIFTMLAIIWNAAARADNTLTKISNMEEKIKSEQLIRKTADDNVSDSLKNIVTAIIENKIATQNLVTSVNRLQVELRKTNDKATYVAGKLDAVVKLK